jgi:hypothetical protein
MESESDPEDNLKLFDKFIEIVGNKYPKTDDIGADM